MRSTFVWVLAGILAGCGSPPTASDASLLYAQSGEGMYTGSDFFTVPPREGVMVHYTGTGACSSLAFAFIPEADPGAIVDMPPIAPASDNQTRGTWYMTVGTGRFRLRGGANGCTWTITIKPFTSPAMQP